MNTVVSDGFETIGINYSNGEIKSIIMPEDSIHQKQQFKNIILAIISLWILSFCFACAALFGEQLLLNRNAFMIVLLSTLLFALLICILYLMLQPQDQVTLEKLHFKVPLVPLLPSCAIICNIMLMVRLSYLTWTRFSVWLAIGFVLYFGYGIRHSKINKYNRISNADDDQIPMLAQSEDS